MGHPRAAAVPAEEEVVRPRAVVPEQVAAAAVPAAAVPAAAVPAEEEVVLPEQVAAAAAQNDCQLLLPKIRITERLLPRTGRLRNAVPPVIRCLIVSLFLSALKALREGEE